MMLKKTCKMVLDGLLMLGIGCAVLLVGEVVLQLLYDDKVASPIAYRYDEEYLVALKPNVQKTYVRKPQNGGQTIVWKTNGEGFRGNALRADSDLRLIVYGDSNIQARFSDLENTFAHKLEQYLRKLAGEDVEVVNGGTVGFGPDQSLIRFAKDADRYRPNLVIFHIFADNDFGELFRNRLFEIDPQGRLVKNSHPRTIDQLIEKDSGFKGWVNSLLLVKAIGKILKAVKKDDAPEDLMRQYLEAGAGEYAVYLQSGSRRFSHFEDHYDLDMALFPQGAAAQAKVQLLEAVLKEAHAVARGREIKFAVLVQPSVIDLTENFRISYEHFRQYPEYRRKNLTDAVKNICLENNIPVLNLYDVFFKNDPSSLYFVAPNNHWNDAGQDLAARATATYINDRFLSPGRE